MGSLWVSSVPGRPWRTRNQKSVPLPPPSAEIQLLMDEAAKRAEEHHPPKMAGHNPASPRRLAPLLPPSPQVLNAMKKAAMRSVRTLPEGAESPRDHLASSHHHVHAHKPRERHDTATTDHEPTSRGRRTVDLAWSSLGSTDHSGGVPLLSHHSLHTIGFGATRQVVVFGGIDRMGRASNAIYTLPVAAIAAVAGISRPVSLPEVRESAAVPAALMAAGVRPELILEMSAVASFQTELDHAINAHHLRWTELEERQLSGTKTFGPKPRYGHASCKWGSHRLLVHGGVGGQEVRPTKLLDDTHVLLVVRKGANLESNSHQWAGIDVAGSKPSARRFHALASLDSRMAFLYGGELSNDDAEDGSSEVRIDRPQSLSSQMFVLVDLSAENEHARTTVNAQIAAKYGYTPDAPTDSPGASFKSTVSAAWGGVAAMGSKEEAVLECTHYIAPSAPSLQPALNLTKAIGTAFEEKRLLWYDLQTVGSLPPPMSKHNLEAAGERTLALCGGCVPGKTVIARYNTST